MASYLRLSNEGCHDQSKLAEKEGRYVEAIKWLNTAYARTIGHSKSERYERMGDRIARQYGVERVHSFAKDTEGHY